MNVKIISECTYTILDNAQAIMSECNRENPYSGYILEKIKPIENDIQVIKEQCSRSNNNEKI